MRVGVLTFPGSHDARDAERAITFSGGTAVSLWYRNADLSTVDAVVIPGGWSYGDYMRAGAIAAMDPVLRQVSEAADQGTPIIGIGNGFQILAAAEILPGSFTLNDGQKYLRRDVAVAIEQTSSVWTRNFSEGEEIILPVRSGYGRYLVDDEALKLLEDSGRVAVRFSGVNPTGSVANIAGITNGRGNVLGILPHPEFAVEAGFGPDSPGAMRSGIDGARFFDSLLETVNA